jgi:gluconolactonase
MAMTKSPEGINVPEHSPPPKPLPPGIQRIDRNGKVTQLYTECGGNPLRWPNDLVFDAHGGFYFTDFGRDVGRTCDLGGLYYAKADGSSIVELIHEAQAFVPLTQPNGVGLSPAGDKVYVAETVTGRLWSWKIKSPGVLAPADQPMSPNGAGLMLGADGIGMLDSLAVDGEGYVCVATLMKGGISVVKPEGGLEDFIQIPGEPFVTNICFGGPDLRTAYVTASSQGKVWAMDWPRQGLRLNYA